MKRKIFVDYRDSVVYDCGAVEPNMVSGLRYGHSNCYSCARSTGTRYADGYQAGCINLPTGTEVPVGTSGEVVYFEADNPEN